ncbi:hypothetical protein LWI29_029705 [Acer saccharum]|uniref:Uncharacterized protein n=1 Tax=Acer saccharum TaxID=4024 RepID=A0AA39T118_ACESA|nr:hypothetical protein LWI29_029705 [Acer saccharum]
MTASPSSVVNPSTKKPPEPHRLPLIGNMHQLVGSLPHHRLQNLAKKYGPLMHLQLGEVPIIEVSSAEIAEEILKTHGIIFSNRPFLIVSGFSIVDLYPSIGMLEVISGIKSKVKKLHQEQDRVIENILDDHKERKRMTKTGQGKAEEDLIDLVD